jgi:hypothetical protein
MCHLNFQVIRALQTHHRTDTQWNDWTNKVFELEDVNRNMVSLSLVILLLIHFNHVVYVE